MLKLPSTLLITVLCIGIGSFILTFFILSPVFLKVDNAIKVLDPVFAPDTPSIQIKTNEISFEGEIPHQVKLDSGATIYFDKNINDSLMDVSRSLSVFIAEHEMWIKTKNDIKKIKFDDINAENKKIPLIKPVAVKKLIDRYKRTLYTIVSIIGFFAAALSLTLVVNFVAGIGFMIDTFSDGQLLFRQTLNLSSISMLVLLIFWIILTDGTFRNITVFLILLIVMTSFIVYFNILWTQGKFKSANRE